MVDLRGTSRSDEYPLFDWLRFVLASAVTLSHVGAIPWPQAGNFAVQIFFALSGWLIGGILIRSDRSILPRFFFNRVTRIWIPYACAVGALYGLSIFRDTVSLRWLEFLFYDVTFTHNWFTLRPDAAAAFAEMPLKGTGNHFWSIAVEEQFYLFAPLLVLFSPVGRHGIFWLITTAAMMGLGLVDFASISLGVACVALDRRYNISRYWLIASIVAILAIAALVVAPRFYLYFAPIVSAALVVTLARPGKRSEIGSFLGGVSYPMYLNHWMGAFLVHGLVKHSFLPAIVEVPLGYLGGLAAGILAYLIVDRNVMKQRASYYSKTLGIAAGSTAYGLLFIGITVGLWIAMTR